MNNVKKTNSIYQNKTNLILDKRKNSTINNKFISNYSSKPIQYNQNDSLIKHKINVKKNNSVCFVKDYQKNKENSINSKVKEKILNNNIEINITNYELL